MDRATFINLDDDIPVKEQCSTAVMVTESKAEAVAAPAPARLPLTKYFAALPRPKPGKLCVTHSAAYSLLRNTVYLYIISVSHD